MDNLERIPSEILTKLTRERVDWERNTLLDDYGRLWTDIHLKIEDREADVRPLPVYGRRAFS